MKRGVRTKQRPGRPPPPPTPDPTVPRAPHTYQTTRRTPRRPAYAPRVPPPRLPCAAAAPPPAALVGLALELWLERGGQVPREPRPRPAVPPPSPRSASNAPPARRGASATAEVRRRLIGAVDPLPSDLPSRVCIDRRRRVVPFAQDRRGSPTRSAGELGGRGAASPHLGGAGGVDSDSTLAVAAVPHEARRRTPTLRPARSSAAAPARTGRRPVAPADRRCASCAGAGRPRLVTALNLQPSLEASDSPICPHLLHGSRPPPRAVCSRPVHAAVVPPRRLRNGSRASPALGHARSAPTATPLVDPSERPQVARSRGLNGRLEGRGGCGGGARAGGRPPRAGRSRGGRPRGAGCRRLAPCPAVTVVRIFRHALNGYRGLQHPNLRFDRGASARRHSR